MATSNFYTGKMKTTTDSSISSVGSKKSKSKIKSKTTRKSKRTVKEDDEENNNSKADSDTKQDKKNASQKGPSEEHGKTDDNEDPKTLKDILSLTNTKITIENQGREQSGLSDDSVESDKIVVKISNDDGSISAIVWDLVKTGFPDEEAAFKEIVNMLIRGESISTADAFKETYGFSLADDVRISKAMNALRKSITELHKMFPDDLFDKVKEMCM